MNVIALPEFLWISSHPAKNEDMIGQMEAELLTADSTDGSSSS